MQSILKDSLALIKKNKDLDKLFIDADNLIPYLLNENFSPYEFYKGLSILGGEEFFRLLIFSLRNFDNQEDFDELLDQGVNEEIINKLKYMVAKYKAKFQNLIDIENNPLGWSNLEPKTVKIGNRNFLELEFILNNHSSFLIRDEPYQYIELFRNVLTELKKMKSALSNEELDQLYTSLEEFKEEISEFNN
jgi:hypothetical protein